MLIKNTLAYGRAFKFAYITLYPEDGAGNRVLVYMQCTAWHNVIRLVEHAPFAKDCI